MKLRYRTVNVRDGKSFRIKSCVVEKLESLQITGKIARARGRLVERAVLDQLSYFGGLFVWTLMLQRCYLLSQFEGHEVYVNANTILKLGKSNVQGILVDTETDIRIDCLGVVLDRTCTVYRGPNVKVGEI